MHNTIEPQTETPKRFQCRHIFTDGHRCGSPCLRGEDLCYYHHTTRKPAPHPRTRRCRRAAFEIPLPEDRSAIQHSIGQVLQRIAANDIDPRRAGLLLYGLQIASLNLPKPQATQPELVEETTTHPELGTLAPPAEIGKTTQRKSAVTRLIEKMLESDRQEKQAQQDAQDEREAQTLPTLQARADDAPHANSLQISRPRNHTRYQQHLRRLAIARNGRHPVLPPTPSFDDRAPEAATRWTPAPWIGTPAASRSTPCQTGCAAFCARIPVENRRQTTSVTTRFLECRLIASCEACGFAFASLTKDSFLSFLKSSSASYCLSSMGSSTRQREHE
jgi:hypothetical protein